MSTGGWVIEGEEGVPCSVRSTVMDGGLRDDKLIMVEAGAHEELGNNDRSLPSGGRRHLPCQYSTLQHRTVMLDGHY